MLKEVESWCAKWRIKVNTNKTKVVHFRSISKDVTTENFPYGGVPLEIVKSYKYLGVIFDEFLNFAEGVQTLAGAGGRGLGKIFASHRRLHGIGFKTYTKLYESMVDPILLCMGQVFGVSKHFPSLKLCRTEPRECFWGCTGMHAMKP